MIPFTSFILVICALLTAYVINYLSDILPLTVEDDEEPPANGAICLTCHARRSWMDFLLLRPCSTCGSKTPLRHGVVLVAMPFLFLFGFYYPPQGLNPLLYIFILVYFALVVIIDIEHRIVLRILTLIGLAAALIAGSQMHGLTLALLGCAAGLFLMILIYIAGIFFSKWMSRRRGEEVDEALGAGDVYISAITGLLMSFPAVFSALLLAIILGGMVSLVFVVFMLIRKEYKSFVPIPYTPFIILATIFLMYRG